MRNLLSSFATPLGMSLLVATAGFAAAQGGIRIAGESVVVRGTVDSVDASDRSVTIRNASGVQQYQVDPSVHSLDNLKAGDRVELNYLVSVAVSLRKGGGDMRAKIQEQAQDAAGARPGGESDRRTVIVANVISIDRARQRARLQGPEGRIVDVKVQDKSALSRVKAGDQVVAVVYEVLAVRISPAAADR